MSLRDALRSWGCTIRVSNSGSPLQTYLPKEQGEVDRPRRSLLPPRRLPYPPQAARPGLSLTWRSQEHGPWNRVTSYLYLGLMEWRPHHKHLPRNETCIYTHIYCIDYNNNLLASCLSILMMNSFTFQFSFEVGILAIFGNLGDHYRVQLRQNYSIVDKGYNSFPCNIPGTRYRKALLVSAI